MSVESSKHDSQLLTAVLQIQSDITFIRTQQADMSKRLFGNGRPGELAELDTRVKTLELKDAKEDGEKNSNRRWSAFISAAVSTIIAWAIEAFAHRK